VTFLDEVLGLGFAEVFKDVGVVDEVEAVVGAGDALGEVVSDDGWASGAEVDVSPVGVKAATTAEVKVVHKNFYNLLFRVILRNALF
jgi:hypothetical protein